MNRDVLLIYLKGLRDLEMAKRQLNIIYNKENSQYKKIERTANAEIEKLKKSNYLREPEKPQMNLPGVIFLLLAILSAILVLYLIYLSISRNKNGFGWVCLFLFITGMWIFCAYQCTPHKKDYQEELARVRRHNAYEKKRMTEDVPSQTQKIRLAFWKEMDQWNTRSEYLKKEHTKVSQLLTAAYNVDILPTPYRNLQSVYYIYDYMSTSQATLEETLVHEHMENGIQRILAKLDTIIAQNEEIIFHSRMIEANTREISDNTVAILEKNQRILESQERTEQNTLEAAQNAQIAANYAEINAFFSTATYLESQRR